LTGYLKLDYSIIREMVKGILSKEYLNGSFLPRDFRRVGRVLGPIIMLSLLVDKENLI
jgi:hypothetical protein